MLFRSVRRLGHDGRLILSGIPESVASQVENTYCRLGLRGSGRHVRAGWVAFLLQAPW